MGDYQYYNNAYTKMNFYQQQYLQQHAIMARYFQRLHSAVSGDGAYDYDPYNPRNKGCPEHPSCSSCNVSEISSYSSSYSSSESYSSHSESETEQDDGIESGDLEDSEEIYEDDESEYDFELNVDAILAMRAAKEELPKEPSSESDSIVLIESDKEDFEFVDYGSINTLQSKLYQSVESSFNKNEDIKAHHQVLQYLYGEKSATIAGLETAMAVHFERLSDIKQPPLWPVLPLRL